MRRGRTIAAAMVLTAALAGPAAAQATGAAVTIHPGHPRLFMTADELPALRDRIARYYRPEFQDFVNLLNDTSALSKSQRRIEANWGGLNYAFVAALDPQEMARRGFRFTSTLATADAYCGRAMMYAGQLLPAVRQAEGQRGEALNTGYPDPKYLSVITTYDWCYSHLTEAERGAIVDAYVSAYDTKYRGHDPRTMDIDGIEMLGSQRSSGDLQDIAGIVGFYGDPYPSPAIQDLLLGTFKTLWLDRFLTELNYFYGPATGWHEGPGGYLSEAFVNISIPVAMFSSALGTDYIAATPFFSRYAVFAAANTRPHSLLEWPYYPRWGTISGGVSGPSCKSLMLNAGMLRRAGHRNAPLAKWMYEKSAQEDCSRTVPQYGGTWSNAVLFWFLYGDRGITPQSPADMDLPHALELGLNEFVMRSGWASTDSQVIFFAQQPAMYGHDTQQYGTFSLHKFGNLIVQAGNTKSGAGKLDRGPDKGALFENVVSLHKGDSDPGLGFTGGREVDPFWGARGIRLIRKAGIVLARTLNADGFDYVAYDNTPMWKASTATVSQREFIYLHGPVDREFVVVFDRFNAVHPATDEKVWKAWVPAPPRFVNGSTETPRPGQWRSTTSDLIELTNQVDGLKGDDFRSAPTHGRFFLKTLWPDQPDTRLVGGPGMEFQSGDDDGTTPWGTPAMTPAEREYLGWGRIEIRPSTRQPYDVFLNVIQFGDADTLERMSPTSRLESADGALVGAHIADASNQWVVLLARTASARYDVGHATYTFEPTGPRTRHLLVDMAPGTTFYVTASAAGAAVRIDVSRSPSPGATASTSDSQGVLSFATNGSVVLTSRG